MAGCFNNSAHDRWIESQVDAYTDGKAFRLSLLDLQRLEDDGLDESDMDNITGICNRMGSCAKGYNGKCYGNLYCHDKEPYESYLEEDNERV